MGLLDQLLQMPMPWQYFQAGAKDFGGDVADALSGKLQGPSFANRSLVMKSPGSFDESGFDRPSGIPPSLVPFGALGLPPSQGFDNGQPPAIDPMTGLPMPVPKLAAAPSPQEKPFGPFPAVPLSGMLSDITSPTLPAFGGQAPAPAPAPMPEPPSIPPQAAPRDGRSLDEMAYGSLAPSLPTKPASMATGSDVLPPNATPAVGDARNLPNMPAAASAAAPASPGIGSRVGDTLTNIAGFLNPDMRQRQIQSQTAAALVKKGIEPDMAASIATNPALLQQVVPQLFGPKKYEHVSIKDAFGNEIPLSYDPSTGRYLSAQGKAFGQPGAAGSAEGTPGIPGAGDFLAKGVTQVNHELVGKPYLEQFSPEVQAGVQNYLDGKTLTTGNARQGFTQTVKMIAQKYGADIGMPADDTTVAARREMRTQLSKGTPGSLGGQLTFGGTSLGHLADVADKATKMGNVNGFGIAPLAALVNNVRGLTTDQAAKVNETSGAVQHYGQEITKFYTGSPGGEAERMRFLKTMDTAKSPQEIAGAIRAERDLIPDRLHQVEAQISDRLGPEEAARQMKRIDLEGVVGRINRSLAKLDPNGPEAKMLAGQSPTQAAPAASPAPAGRTSGGVSWSIVQ